MSEIKQLEVKAYNYLLEKDPNSWCRAFFKEGRACEALENGVSESFNAWIVEARFRPIITMLEEIRMSVMKRVYNQRLRAENWADGICPNIKKKLQILISRQRYWTVLPSGGNDFEVKNGYEGYHVQLDNKCCSCRVWQLSGVPCVHAVGAISFLNQEPFKYVSTWFTKEMFLKSYQYPLKPMNGSTMLNKTPHKPPLPPKNRRMPGRPKTKRKIDESEKEAATHTVST